MGDGKGCSQAQERLNKINEIWEMVRDKPTGYPKKKLIAEFCLKYGTRRRTVLEYVGLLIDAEKMEEINGVFHC
jgi:hypothetical protein